MQVLSVNVDDTEDDNTVRNWASNLGLTYTLLQDVNDQVYYQYSPGPPHYIPHNVLLDTAMQVIYTAIGWNKNAVLNQLNTYYQPAYTNNISLSHGYMQMGVDTLVITSQSTNPGSHNIEIYATLLSIDSSYVDSLMLYDDGAHNDGAAGDGLFGNSMLAPIIEQEVMVGTKMYDIDNSVEIVLNDLDRFTTIGPLSVNGCIEILRVSNRIYYQMEIRNNGSSTAARNVQAKITISDPYVTGMLSDFQNFGSISAGSTGLSSGNFGVTTVNLPANHTFVFHAQIYSNNSLYWEDSTSVFVGISEADDQIPQVFSLKQNYPNPFNPKTTIEFSIPKAEYVELKIFDAKGKEIQTLVSDNMSAGVYKYDWYAADNVASGIYYYVIKAGEFTDTKKLVLMK